MFTSFLQLLLSLSLNYKFTTDIVKRLNSQDNICHNVLGPFLVDNLDVISYEFNYPFLLVGHVDSLLHQVS